MAFFDIFKKSFNLKKEKNEERQNFAELISSEKQGDWRIFDYKTNRYGYDFMLDFGQAFINCASRIDTACTSPMVNCPEEEHINDLHEANNLLRNCEAFNPGDGEENGYISIGGGIHKHIFDVGTPLKIFLFNQLDFIKVYAIDLPDKEKQRETEKKLTSFINYLCKEATMPKFDFNHLVDIETEFNNVYMQTTSKPLGDEESAWNWVKERIIYFKENNFNKNKLYQLEKNVLINLTESYLLHFEEYRSIVNDLSPVILACEECLNNGNAEKANKISSPYLKYVKETAAACVGTKICYQNKAEHFLMFFDYNHMKEMPLVDDNYTYYLVLYCRILDNILINHPDKMEKIIVTKRELLNIAKEISPWNSSVWEALSRVAVTEEEYKDCIVRALKYVCIDNGPYGIGQIYANMAMHYIDENSQLSRALCSVSRRFGGNPSGAEYILSKKNIAPISRQTICDNILAENNVQIGYSLLAENARKI